MKWFRFYNDAIADSKLRLLAFEDRWHYVAVLCMKSSGLLDQKKNELRERRIASDLGLTLQEAEQVKRRLMEVELVSKDWQPKSWDKRQYKHDNNAERQKEYRERKKQKDQGLNDDDSNVSKTSPLRNAHVTVTGTDTDTDTDTERDKDHRQQAVSLGVSEDLWDEYIKTRKRLKASNTPLALTTLINKLKKAADQGISPQELIEKANESGWKTVYPPEKQDSGPLPRSMRGNK